MFIVKDIDNLADSLQFRLLFSLQASQQQKYVYRLQKPQSGAWPPWDCLSNTRQRLAGQWKAELLPIWSFLLIIRLHLKGISDRIKQNIRSWALQLFLERILPVDSHVKVLICPGLCYTILIYFGQLCVTICPNGFSDTFGNT